MAAGEAYPIPQNHVPQTQGVLSTHVAPAGS